MTQLKTKGPYPADKFGWIGQERRINEDRDGKKHSLIGNCFEMKNQRKNWATLSRISKASIFVLIGDRRNNFVYFLDVSGLIDHAAAEQPQISNSNNIQFKSEFPDLFHLPVFLGKITFSLINTLKFQASLLCRKI